MSGPWQRHRSLFQMSPGRCVICGRGLRRLARTETPPPTQKTNAGCSVDEEHAAMEQLMMLIRAMITCVLPGAQ